MIRYLINNPTKWQELELFRFLHTFSTPFDRQILDYLNSPTNEKAFLKGLNPINRAYYNNLEIVDYNDDNELLSECYLLAEKSMLDNTSLLLRRITKELPNRDVFESLEDLKDSTELILEGVLFIKGGGNPRVLADMLASFLSPKQRAKIAETVG